jgi:very-short-patch-repair endonuclease
MNEFDPDAWRALLARQAGAVTRAQALARGITDGTIAAHLAAGRWQRAVPGVYLTFTGPPPVQARRWVAVLYGGPGVALSHESAGVLWGLLDAPAESAVHLTVARPRSVCRQRGLRVHHSRRPVRAVASPPRTPAATTVFDLAARAARMADALALIARARQRGVAPAGALIAELESRPTQRWRGTLLAAVDESASGAHSVLELRYLHDVERAHDLPLGHRQRAIGGTRQDVHYAAFRTTVELDGRLGHSNPGERWRDLARDNAAAVRGETALRYGWADVADRPCEVAGQVAAVLRRRGWAGVAARCGAGCGAAS